MAGNEFATGVINQEESEIIGAEVIDQIQQQVTHAPRPRAMGGRPRRLELYFVRARQCCRGVRVRP